MIGGGDPTFSPERRVSAGKRTFTRGYAKVRVVPEGDIGRLGDGHRNWAYPNMRPELPNRRLTSLLEIVLGALSRREAAASATTPVKMEREMASAANTERV